MVALPLLAALAAVAADVPVYVAAELRPGSLEAALEEVDAIFAPGGIHFRWRLSLGEELSPAFPVVVIVQNAPPDQRVYGCRRNRHDHRLGHTNLRARRVTLWSHQITRAATGEWEGEEVPDIDPDRFARALGRVLAHELGHLFLGLDGHYERGLMRSSFSRRSLVARNRRSFRLRASDHDRIRGALAPPGFGGDRRRADSSSK